MDQSRRNYLLAIGTLFASPGAAVILTNSRNERKIRNEREGDIWIDASTGNIFTKLNNAWQFLTRYPENTHE